MKAAEYTPSDLPKPWICSCFTSKAYACVFEDYRKRKLNADSKVLFWDTKSVVQPVARDQEKDPLSFDEVHKRVASKEKTFLKKCGCGSQDGLDAMLEATVMPDAHKWAQLSRSAL
jgi:hypothetical protein